MLTRGDKIGMTVAVLVVWAVFTVGFFGACEHLDLPCRIAWHQQATFARLP